MDEPEEDLKARVAKLATDVADRLGSGKTFQVSEIFVNADYADPGYGVLTEVEREAVRLFAKLEGLLIDPVYTGRAAGGMIDLIRNGYFKSDETVLFWHTGGTPALLAEEYRDL